MTGVGRKLRVRIRSDIPNHHYDSSGTLNNPKKSLFARLHPIIAQSLLNDALHDRDDHHFSYANGDSYWDVLSSSQYPSNACSSGVEFLPLAVTFPPSTLTKNNNETTTIYVSYNGGSILVDESERVASDNDSINMIELPQSLLPDHIQQAMTVGGYEIGGAVVVTVQALPLINNASFLQVDPLTTEDWELLETSSEFLESGGLLQQVSVVYPHEKLQLYVGSHGYDTVHVSVKPSNFLSSSSTTVCNYNSSSTSSSSSEEESDEDDDDTLVTNNQRCCLRLVADTEVIITPKPRSEKQRTDFSLSQPLRVYPTWDDWSKPMKELCKSLVVTSLDVPPLSMCAHPDTLNKHVPGWDKELAKVPHKDYSMLAVVSKVGQHTESDTPSTVVVRIYASNDVPSGHVALNQGVRYQIGVTPLYDKLRLRILSTEEEEMGPNQVREFLKKGTLQISLRAWIPNRELPRASPWLRPSQFLKTSLQHECMYDPSMISVHSIDVPSDCKRLPCSQGCLVCLPWIDKTCNSGSRLKYEILFSWISPQRDNRRNEPPLFIFAEDLSKVLSNTLKEQPVYSRYKSVDSFSNIPEDNGLLNLLPYTEHQECEDHVQSQRKLPAVVSESQHFQTTMITGDPGSGKTHTALLLAARIRLVRGVGTLYIDCKRLQSSSDIRMKNILNEFTMIFKKALLMGSCIVVLDDIDLLVPNNLALGQKDPGSVHHQQTNPIAIDQAKLISDHVRNLVDELFARQIHNEGIVEPSGIILTCRNDASVAPCLLHPQGGTSCWPVPDLNETERTIVLSKMLDEALEKSLRERYSLSSTLIHRLIRSFGKKTEGFKPHDLAVIAARVDHKLYTTTLYANRNDPPSVDRSISGEAVTSAVLQVLSSYTPISQQLVGAEVTQCASWSEIGGLFQAKEQLAETIVRPVKYSALYRRAPIKLPRGVLLFGFPGCGKSHLVPALAKECGLNLITCRGPELLDKYIGASEQKVRDLFMRAYSAAPSILFLDEFDSLAPRRGSDHTGVTDRVVNQLLTFLDGVEDNGGKMVYILGATSRPDRVDPALLRPGRLGMHIFIGRTQTDDEWHDLFQKIAFGRNVDAEVADVISRGKILEILGSSSDQLRNFTAADMKAVMDTAHLDAVHSFLANRSESGRQLEANADDVCVRLPNIIKALQATRPSISSDDQLMLSRIYNTFIGSSGRNPIKGNNDKHGALDTYPPGGTVLKSTLR